MINLDNCRILCTGGNGFIGSNFIEYLYKNYENIVVCNIDKRGIGSRDLNPENSFLSYQEYMWDIRHMINITPNSYIFPHHEYDYVFHFAAESHVDRSINSPSDFIDNNVMGISSILEYCRRYQPQARIINVSTDEVYGHLELNDRPFTENSGLDPRSPYSASKASADLIAGSYYSTYGMDIITTRCCNNYGPHQHSEKFIPTVIRSLKNGQKIPVYGNGQNIREWIYVDDHNKSILEIAEIGQSGMVYNIGSGREKTNLQLISDIITLGDFGGTLEDHIEFVEDRKGHDFRYAISSVNYTRQFELMDYNEALDKTIKHYLNQ